MLLTFFIQYSVYLVTAGCYLLLFTEWYFKKYVASRVLIKDDELIPLYIELLRIKNKARNNEKTNNDIINLFK